MRWFVIDTAGATAPEFVSAALQRSAGVVVLPGLAYVRDGTRLYRRHELAGLDAAAVFERLWQPSFEPGGRMWAGIARRLPYDIYRELPLDAARARFVAQWSGELDYTRTLFLFAQCVAPALQVDKPAASHLGFCGAPFLRTIAWDELIAHRVTVVSARVPVPVWLVLVSERSIVNPRDALRYWIVHRVVLAAARRHGVDIVEVDALRVASDGIDAPLARALGLGSREAVDVLPDGHARFSAAGFAPVLALADTLQGIYAADPLLLLAESIDTLLERHADALLPDAPLGRLVARYLRYWNSTAHIHFDTPGPLEHEIVGAVLCLAGAPDDSAAPPDQGLAWDFYQRWIRFRSYRFESVEVELDGYLGSLEDEIALPPLPYFVQAVLAYLGRCLEHQGKWFDSYQPLAASAFHRVLRSARFAPVLALHGFAQRLAQLEEADARIAERALQRSRDPHATGDDGGADPCA